MLNRTQSSPEPAEAAQLTSQICVVRLPVAIPATGRDPAPRKPGTSTVAVRAMGPDRPRRRRQAPTSGDRGGRGPLTVPDREEVLVASLGPRRTGAAAQAIRRGSVETAGVAADLAVGHAAELIDDEVAGAAVGGVVQ